MKALASEMRRELRVKPLHQLRFVRSVEILNATGFRTAQVIVLLRPCVEASRAVTAVRELGNQTASDERIERLVHGRQTYRGHDLANGEKHLVSGRVRGNLTLEVAKNLKPLLGAAQSTRFEQAPDHLVVRNRQIDAQLVDLVMIHGFRNDFPGA
jgi:hypothetical protein